jgi:isoleucyl-tRNA synthetase
LFEKAPFQNVICTGMILAEDGKKMSKRLKNYPDPQKLMDTHGADALRLYMISSAVVRAESLRFSETGVKEIVRSVLLPFWNAYSFFTTYASLDKYQRSSSPQISSNPLDRWIVSRFQSLLISIEREMAAYHLYAVVPELLSFIEELTNWYIRRSRRRFWSNDAEDKQHGYDTMYYVLMNFTKALAPFLPFVTEEIFDNLRSLDPSLPESVHLCDYPVADPVLRDKALEEAMALIQQAVYLGRGLRATVDVRIRQPLASITVVTRNTEAEETLRSYGVHIMEELNVKQVLFSSKEDELVSLTVKPLFPVLGPIFGKEMGQVSAALAKLTSDEVLAIEQGGSIAILGREITKESLDIRRKAVADTPIETANGITVFYNLVLTNELKAEGLAREFVNRVQRMRKEADFQVSDRIVIGFNADSELSQYLMDCREYIVDELLGVSLESNIAPQTLNGRSYEWEALQLVDIEGISVEIGVARA